MLTITGIVIAHSHVMILICDSSRWSNRHWQYITSRITDAIQVYLPPPADKWQCVHLLKEYVSSSHINAHACYHLLRMVTRVMTMAYTKPQFSASATIDETTEIVARMRLLQQSMKKVTPLLQQWLFQWAGMS